MYVDNHIIILSNIMSTSCLRIEDIKICSQKPLNVIYIYYLSEKDCRLRRFYCRDVMEVKGHNENHVGGGKVNTVC